MMSELTLLSVCPRITVNLLVKVVNVPLCLADFDEFCVDSVK